MAKGGYQIIDLKNEDLRTGIGHDFSDEKIYEILEGTRSPILLTNIVIDGVELHDTFVTISRTGDAYCMGIHPIDLTSTGTDILGGHSIGIKVEDTNVLTVYKKGYTL